jgi:hypothetical protein
MQVSDRNPFNEMSLTELADASRGLVITLQERKQRTSQERADLVFRAIKLLAVVAERLEPKPYTPHYPECYIEKGRADIAALYIAWHEGEMERAQRAVRYRTLSRMANLVIGADAGRWIHPQTGAFDDRPLYKATASDEGLFECLRKLEALARSEDASAA